MGAIADADFSRAGTTCTGGQREGGAPAESDDDPDGECESCEEQCDEDVALEEELHGAGGDGHDDGDDECEAVDEYENEEEETGMPSPQEVAEEFMAEVAGS